MTLPTPAPIPSTDTASFWAATDRAELQLQRCADCDAVIWYPRPICPKCWGQSLVTFEASGVGTVYSWSRTVKGNGDYRDAGPYYLAYVELDEGPRLMTNIVEGEPQIGQRVEVVFHDTGQGNALVRFRPKTQR